LRCCDKSGLQARDSLAAPKCRDSGTLAHKSVTRNQQERNLTYLATTCTRLERGAIDERNVLKTWTEEAGAIGLDRRESRARG